MKIILSRKGFDAKFGGKPSPILPDGTLLSLPIPNMKYVSNILYDGKIYEPTQYKDLQIPKSAQDILISNNIEEINTYKDLMLNLGIISIKDTPNKTYSLLDDQPLYCHLDPDLIHGTLKRKKDWRGTFGQDGIAALHLDGQDVKEGDLFLFYGWFRKTLIYNKSLIYDKTDVSGKHIIFGYLQIGKKLNIDNINKINKSNWIYTYQYPHPHLDKKLWDKLGITNTITNTIYIACNSLSLKPEYQGWGTFKFDENLILTEMDNLKNPIKEDGTQNRSYWKKTLFPYGIKISYHPNKNAWFGDDGEELSYFKTKSPGQEYVIPEDKNFFSYIKNLNYSKKIN
jgi:hypothetical protein